jgi:predicted secreted hydrolase
VDGRIRHLGAGEVELVVTARWTSPASGATYPAGWRLAVPSAGLDLVVEPLLTAAEVDGRRSTGVVYWEGPVAVRGTHGGEGYAELTGYAGSLAGLF